MKEVKEMPESGQFVMVWECGGKVWSSTIKRLLPDCFEVHNEWADDFEYASWDVMPNELMTNVRYFIAD